MTPIKEPAGTRPNSDQRAEAGAGGDDEHDQNLVFHRFQRRVAGQDLTGPTP